LLAPESIEENFAVVEDVPEVISQTFSPAPVDPEAQVAIQ
jgi:hypothetical protein